MTLVKLCGLMSPEDIEMANLLRPDYTGFVFAANSRRCITETQARHFRSLLSPDIPAVGVFVNEDPARVAFLLEKGVVDLAQLHGTEDETYLSHLRHMTAKPLIRAFQIRSQEDLTAAAASTADYILLDSGTGSGSVFDWDLLNGFSRPYFLAGGLSPDNVAAAVRTLHPYAVDVSSGIETGGKKDPAKMLQFMRQVKDSEHFTVSNQQTERS